MNWLQRYRSRLSTDGTPILIFALLASGLTWPLVAFPTTRLLLGTEAAATVPLFNLWTLRWNAYRLLHGYAGYWDAPIFFPEPGALALADPQPLTGFAFALLSLVSGNEVLAFNLIILVGLTLNGYSAYRWLSSARVDMCPALLAGALALSLPFVFNELGVLQLTFVFPVFFALGALYEFAQKSSLRPALALGAWTATTYLFSGYYGVYLSFFLIVGAAVFATRRHFRVAALRALGLGILLGFTLLAPVVSAQLRYAGPFNRSTLTIERNSAQLVDYLELHASALGSNVAPWLSAAGSGSPQRLYPGSALLMLALVGGFAAWRRDRRWLIFCGISGSLAVALSLGPGLSVGKWQPYALLRDFYPGFAQLRSPFRMGLFAQVFLIWPAGAGLQALWRYHDRLGRTVAVGVTIMGILEVASLPARLTESAWHEQSAWAIWIENQPDGPVALLPFPASGRSSDYEPTVIAMHNLMDTSHPLVNGYSGFFPQTYRNLRQAVSNFPSNDSLIALSKAGVVYLAVEKKYLSSVAEEQVPGLHPIYTDSQRTVFIFKTTDG